MTDGFSKKLAQFAPTPPAGAWDKIAGALDEEAGVGKRLLNYQQDPPRAVWAAIEKTLDNHIPAKEVSFFTRYQTPLRYLAAASLLAAVLVAATLLLNPKTNNTVISKVPAQKAKPGSEEKNQTATVQTDPSRNSEPSIEQARNNSAEPTRSTIAKRTLAFIRPQSIFSSVAFRHAFIPRRAKEQPLVNTNISDDLMVYSDGNGLAMKLPKKLFSLVNCVDGDGSCKERIRQLQQKMASNTATSDFGGMLDLLRQLQ